MIAVDTSALIAIILREPEAGACAAILESEPHVLISARTLAEALIVAARRSVGDALCIFAAASLPRRRLRLLC